jgi:hypothetical protein
MWQTVADSSALGPLTLLLAAAGDGDALLHAEETLRPLATIPARLCAEPRDTMVAFLRHNQNMQRAANALHVHVNDFLPAAGLHHRAVRRPLAGHHSTASPSASRSRSPTWPPELPPRHTPHPRHGDVTAHRARAGRALIPKVHARFETSQILDFVPLLVEKSARRELNHEPLISPMG